MGAQSETPIEEQLDTGLQPAARTPSNTPSQASIYGVFLHLLEGALTEFMSLPPNLCVVPTKAISSQNREDPTDMGSHLTPSSPLTCSTLEKQEEEGDEQVQDLHG